MMELIADLLELEDHTVHTCKNGKEALSFLEQNPAPDIIITDLIMPVMDGVSFLKHLRSQAKWSQLPCLVISGDPNDRQRALDSGADDFLVKPFQSRDLRAVLARLLSP